jgi:hypothetical protein
VDSQGLVLKAKLRAASVFDGRDGIKPLMALLRSRFARLSHLWLNANGYNAASGQGLWAEKQALGLSITLVRP